MSLFSVFSPLTYPINLSLNWVVFFTSSLFILSPYWQNSFSMQTVFLETAKKVMTDMAGIFSPNLVACNFLMFLSLYTTLFTFNLLGLLPYVFPGTGHLPLAISLALPLWVGHRAHGWRHQPNLMAAHLVPTGSPAGLMPFMVLIELMSNYMRPVSLSVRLVANIVAGHLLMTLLSNPVEMKPGVVLMALILAGLIILSCLETAVAVIQAYVFSILSTIYVSEVNSTLVAIK